MLRGFYKASNADTRSAAEPGEVEQIAAAEGLSQDDAWSAVRYLCNEGLLEQHAISLWGITHEGIREYEQSRRHPNEDTEHFAATVIHNVFNISGGNIGAVQAGAGSTAHVAQQFNSPPDELVRLLSELRSAATALPANKRGEAAELVDAIEEQAQSKTPKTSRVKAYAETLKALLPDAVKIIAAIVQIFILKDPALPP